MLCFKGLECCVSKDQTVVSSLWLVTTFVLSLLTSTNKTSVLFCLYSIRWLRVLLRVHTLCENNNTEWGTAYDSQQVSTLAEVLHYKGTY